MVKRVFNKSNYQEIDEAFVRSEVQYYYLRVDKRDIPDSDQVICVEDIYDHYPTDDDKEQLYGDYLAMCKKVAKANASNYAGSDSVEVFEIGGVSGWFDDSKRTSIRNSVSAEKAAGRATSKIYVDGVAFDMPCDDAIAMIDTIELYSKDCFVVTNNHKAVIDALETIEEAEDYDYTTGYPAHPTFNYEA